MMAAVIRLATALLTEVEAAITIGTTTVNSDSLSVGRDEEVKLAHLFVSASASSASAIEQPRST